MADNSVKFGLQVLGNTARNIAAEELFGTLGSLGAESFPLSRRQLRRKDFALLRRLRGSVHLETLGARKAGNSLSFLAHFGLREAFLPDLGTENALSFNRLDIAVL